MVTLSAMRGEGSSCAGGSYEWEGGLIEVRAGGLSSRGMHDQLLRRMRNGMMSLALIRRQEHTDRVLRE